MTEVVVYLHNGWARGELINHDDATENEEAFIKVAKELLGTSERVFALREAYVELGGHGEHRKVAVLRLRDAVGLLGAGGSDTTSLGAILNK